MCDGDPDAGPSFPLIQWLSYLTLSMIIEMISNNADAALGELIEDFQKVVRTFRVLGGVGGFRAMKAFWGWPDGCTCGVVELIKVETGDLMRLFQYRTCLR